MKYKLSENRTRGAIFLNLLIAAVALFFNGFGVYLTIRADIGAAPWDVFNIGLSNTLGILYGTASIAVSVTILLIDIAMREPIGIVLAVDAVVVGKTVDLFNFIEVIPAPKNLADSIFMMAVGLIIIGYTQYFYMIASLGCGPRDTLLVGLKRHMKKIPIGFIEVMITSCATFIGFLLGGPVGIGTIICAACSGPVMQFAFFTLRFNATSVRHQNVIESLKIIFGRKPKQDD